MQASLVKIPLLASKLKKTWLLAAKLPPTAPRVPLTLGRIAGRIVPRKAKTRSQPELTRKHAARSPLRLACPVTRPCSVCRKLSLCSSRPSRAGAANSVSGGGGSMPYDS